MNEDVIADLKQFIASTISQQTSDLRDEINRLDTKIDTVENRLSAKIDNLSTSVADAIETTNSVADDQLNDHEHRITRLEQTLAQPAT